jgi:hypothetical protein
VRVKREWLVPLTGVLFVVLLIASFAIAGEPPDADESVQDIVDHYVDNKDAIWASTLVGMLAALSLVFFGAYLRKVFSAAEPAGHGMLSPLVLAGTVIMAVGAGIDMTISVSLAEAADDIDPVAVQALQAFWDNDFVPIAIGVEVLLLGAGLSIVRYGALPKWLGWVALVLTVVGLTPVGFFAFPLGGIWLIIVSILLAVRARRLTAPAAPPPPPAAPVT